MGLSVVNLAVARGGVPVLEGLSFVLQPGRALVLRGPNGIGKTTLLRCIAGLQPALSGHILQTDQSVAYAAHADGVKYALTVAENLRFWAEVYGTGDIAKAMAAYDLDGLATRPASQLSAGQKRRLGLARLLVTGRPVWALDEPTVSLDARAVQLFADAVSAHMAQGGSALIATHVDLGVTADHLDLSPYRARLTAGFGAFDAAFG